MKVCPICGGWAPRDVEGPFCPNQDRGDHMLISGYEYVGPKSIFPDSLIVHKAYVKTWIADMIRDRMMNAALKEIPLIDYLRNIHAFRRMANL